MTGGGRFRAELTRKRVLAIGCSSEGLETIRKPRFAAGILDLHNTWQAFDKVKG